MLSPEQLFLLQLQLQHERVELHVKVVGPFQLALVVLPDVQSMPRDGEGEKKAINHLIPVTWNNSLSRAECVKLISDSGPKSIHDAC